MHSPAECGAELQLLQGAARPCHHQIASGHLGLCQKQLQLLRDDQMVWIIYIRATRESASVVHLKTDGWLLKTPPNSHLREQVRLGGLLHDEHIRHSFLHPNAVHHFLDVLGNGLGGAPRRLILYKETEIDSV